MAVHDLDRLHPFVDRPVVRSLDQPIEVLGHSTLLDARGFGEIRPADPAMGMEVLVGPHRVTEERDELRARVVGLGKPVKSALQRVERPQAVRWVAAISMLVSAWFACAIETASGATSPGMV